MVERGPFIETLFSLNMNSPFFSVYGALAKTRLWLEIHTEELLERCQASQALATSLTPTSQKTEPPYSIGISFPGEYLHPPFRPPLCILTSTRQISQTAFY